MNNPHQNARTFCRFPAQADLHRATPTPLRRLLGNSTSGQPGARWINSLNRYVKTSRPQEEIADTPFRTVYSDLSAGVTHALIFDGAGSAMPGRSGTIR